MLSKTFLIEPSEKFDGALGARPFNMPHADPLGGTAVAHDVLEHFPGDQGSVAEELMALGAAYKLRGETGHMINGPAKSIGYEFTDLFEHLVFEGFALPDPPPVSKRAIKEHKLEIFNESVEVGFNAIRDQFQGKHLDQGGWMLKRDVWAGWLQHGYLKARRRWRDVPCVYSLGCLFKQVAEEADTAIKQGDQGDEFRVSVNLRRIQYTFTVTPYRGE